MNPQPIHRVIRVTSLAEFQLEVPPEPALPGCKPIARVLMRRNVGDCHAALMLSLQSVNANNEIVWLCEARTVSWLFGRPFGLAAESIAAGMNRLQIVLKQWLSSQGYDVRGGDYGLARTIKPLSGSFECAKWVTICENNYKVEANYEQYS